MDIQNYMVSHFAGDLELIDRLKQAISSAREASIPIIYVVVKFRPGFPEFSSSNKIFSAHKLASLPLVENDSMTDISASVAPQPGDIIVTKRRVGAFSGSDLEIVLRSQGIGHLVLTGISTSGVVLSTLRAAADMDYQITVLSDCCFDRDGEIQRVLMEKVFPMQSDVITSKQWAQRLMTPLFQGASAQLG
jgi:nicotinamidase-related amidase